MNQSPSRLEILPHIAGPLDGSPYATVVKVSHVVSLTLISALFIVNILCSFVIVGGQQVSTCIDRLPVSTCNLIMSCKQYLSHLGRN